MRANDWLSISDELSDDSDDDVRAIRRDQRRGGGGYIYQRRVLLNVYSLHRHLTRARG